MGFLKRLLGGGDQEQPVQMTFATFDHQRPDAELDIVGEASYQPALEQVSGGRTLDGPARPNQQALLIREPENEYDPNAIAVHIRLPDASAPRVGYLSRSHAIAYGPLFQFIAPRSILCQAHLKGGWDRGSGDTGTIGVVLHLGSPAELAADRWLEGHAAPSQHPWAGKLITFTGSSLYAVGPVPLDKPGQTYLAERAGCKTWPRVTKKVEVCVVSRPDEETGNLKKAEDYGLELVRESDFWQGIGLQLSPAPRR